MSRSKNCVGVSISLGLSLVLVVGLVSGCSSEKKKKDDGPPPVPVEQTTKPTEVTAKPLGVESPRAFGYKWGKGSKDFAAAEKLLKAEARDWKAIADSAKAAVAADAKHLAAHRLLGIALANSGNAADGAKAAEHISIALAGDWLRWGPTLAEDKSLQEFFKTADGKGLLALRDKYADSFRSFTEGTVLVVAKRTGWKRPKKTGRQWGASRGEVFAYHLDEERYLRITHTGESVVGFIMSPSKDQLAYLAVSHYNIDADGSISISDASVGTIDNTSYVRAGEVARLRKAKAASLALYYGAGEELLLDAGKKVYSVDLTGGKLKASRAKSLGGWSSLGSQGAGDNTVVFHNPELGVVLSPAEGVKGLGTSAVTVGDKKVELPEAGGDKVRSVSVSPDKSYWALVGIGDPCQKDHQSTIYLVDGESGALKHVHRGNGRQAVRWLDENRFIFEAEPGELRIYDASSKNTTHTIKNRYGLSLSAVSNVVAGEPCTGAAATAPGNPAPAGEESAKPAPAAPKGLTLPAKTGASGKEQTP